MEEQKKYKILDGTMLKLIAMVSMVFDHVGDNFFPSAEWMRGIGRIAMPLFAFCIAEGYTHTRSKTKYLLRMLIFALVSEIPFDLVVEGKILGFGHQNIMFSFAWTILGLLCFDKILGEKKTKGRYALGILALMGFAAGALLLQLDYNILAVGLVSIFYILSTRPMIVKNLSAIVYHVLLRNKGIYWFGLLGFIPLFFYNGKKGIGLKWFFYLFYPCHLLLIFLVKTLIGA